MSFILSLTDHGRGGGERVTVSDDVAGETLTSYMSSRERFR